MPADEKLIEVEGYIKPFPSLRLKGSKSELIFKFLGTYISSNHDIGKLIYTLSKDLKKLTIQQFDEALADLIFSFQNYLNSSISYSLQHKLDIRKVKDLFTLIIPPDRETFDTRILWKTVFSTIYNLALLLDTDLVNNLLIFAKIFLSLITIANKTLIFSNEETLIMLHNFNPIKTYTFLIKS